MQVSNPVPNLRAETAHIGKSVLVKGELSGSEDLYVDGEVEGTIELRGHNLIIGPNGRVRATVNACQVIVHGTVTGNIQASERVELKQSAHVAGDIVTQRVAIEEGAYFKGGIDIQSARQGQLDLPKESSKPAPATVSVPVPAAAVAGKGTAADSQ